MIERELYMQQIRPFINRPFVKVITGIRRSGKSVVLRLIYNELKNQGVEERRIVYMNFESFEWIDLLDAKALYAHMKAVVEKTEGRIYILLDEVQEVKGWERAVNSFLVDWDVDVYVTGSNSKLLSSELATYLAGRYVSFHVMPLSFREYLLFHAIAPGEQKEVLRGEFQKYLRMGGFPVVHTADYDYEAICIFVGIHAIALWLACRSRESKANGLCPIQHTGRNGNERGIFHGLSLGEQLLFGNTRRRDG